MDDPSRRRLLATLGIGAATIAGCGGLDGDDDPTETTEPGGPGGQPTANGTADGAGTTETATGESATGESDPTSAPATTTESSLDRREANVVDVTVTSEGEDAYRFDVTLHHDDAGEEGYANWWQVETLGGERVGRRELLHAHSEQPFTRSATISVTSSVDCVVVRGHDDTHGYGGRAVLVTLATGETAVLRQGSARESAATLACPGTQ